MSFPSNNETGPLTAIEATGTYWLLKDKKGFAWLGVNGRKSAYPIFTDYQYSQRKINSGNWKLVGVEVKKGVRKIAEQHNTDKRLRIITIDRQFTSKSNSTIYKVNTTGFDNQEEFFGMNFPGDNESTKINYWAPNRFFSSLWGFKNNAGAGGGNVVNAFKKFDTPDQGIAKSSDPNLVAVLDSGIRRTHEDLYENMWVNTGESVNPNGKDNDGNGYVDDRYGIAMINGSQNNGAEFYISDQDGHGTHVAGTVGAASNNVGVIGTNPAAKIMNVNVLGPYGGMVDDIINGIQYAATNGSKIINMSFAGGYSKAEYDMMKKVANSNGVLYIAAAGNENNNNDSNPNYSYPSAYNLNSIISVAASNDQGQRASFSNYGKKTVDLYAPGEKILSTYIDSNSSYKHLQGTSMAAPFVAGAVSAYWARNKSLTNIQVKNHLLSTTTKSAAYANTVSGGIINMNKMFSQQQSSAKASAELSGNNGEDHNTKEVRRWERLYEIEASELSGFKSKKITTTLFGHLSDQWRKGYKRNFIERESLNDNGLFKHIKNVDTFGNLNPGFITFDLDLSYGLSKKVILKRLFNKNVFSSVEINQKVTKSNSADNTGVERLIDSSTDDNLTGVRSNNVLKGGIDDDVLTGGVINDRIYGGAGDDVLSGGGGKDRVWGQGGRDTFRVQRGSGYTIIEDFNDGQDRIQIGSGFSGLKLKTSGDNILLYQRSDLMAVVEDAAGDLNRSGNFLV